MILGLSSLHLYSKCSASMIQALVNFFTLEWDPGISYRAFNKMYVETVLHLPITIIVSYTGHCFSASFCSYELCFSTISVSINQCFNKVSTPDITAMYCDLRGWIKGIRKYCC